MSEDKTNEEAPVIRIAYTIIQQAIRDGASEILLEPGVSPSTSPKALNAEVQLAIEASRESGAWAEPGKSVLRVSYKIGGEWQEIMPLPDYLHEPLTERFKQMADVDLACTDKPQEGRIPIRWADKNYTLLLSTKPSAQGETVLMRLA